MTPADPDPRSPFDVATQVDASAPVEAQLRTMLDSVDATIALFDEEGRLTAFNRLAQLRSLEFYGEPLVIGQTFPNPAFDPLLRRALAGETVAERVGPEQRDADVPAYWVDLRIDPVRDAEGRVVGACYHSVDVTASVLRERAEARASAFRRALLDLTSYVLSPDLSSDLYGRVLDLAIQHIEGASTGSVMVKSDEGRYRFVSARGYDFAAMRDAELPAEFVETRRPPTTGVVARDPDDPLEGIDEALGERLRVAMGYDRPRSTLSIPVRVGGVLVAFLSLDTVDAAAPFDERAVEDGELLAAQIGALLQRLALEASLRAERGRLHHMAHHDPLTGLANRALLEARLALTLSRDRRAGALTALVVIDLDGFKGVNDRFGHAAGDALLVRVAGALEAGVRAGDTVARWGGDEFAVVAGGVTDDASVRHVAEQLLERLHDALRDDPSGADVRASVGVAVAAPEQDDPADLLHRADLAMYRAKQAGGGRLAFDDEVPGRVPADV